MLDIIKRVGKSFFYSSFLYMVFSIILYIIINKINSNFIILVNILSYILIYIIYKKFNQLEILKSPIKIKYIMLSIVSPIFIVFIVTNILSYMNVPIKGNAQAIINSGVVSIIYAIVFAPVLEEFIFRGIIKDIMKDDLSFILISGIMFGVLHIGGGDGSYVSNITILTVTSLLGFFWAYIYTKSKSIYTTIIGHCVFNSIVVALNVLH